EVVVVHWYWRAQEIRRSRPLHAVREVGELSEGEPSRHGDPVGQRLSRHPSDGRTHVGVELLELGSDLPTGSGKDGGQRPDGRDTAGALVARQRMPADTG